MEAQLRGLLGEHALTSEPQFSYLQGVMQLPGMKVEQGDMLLSLHELQRRDARFS